MNMKKIIMMAVLLCMTTVTVKAQDVFYEILRTSKAVAEDKSKDIETRKIATFKYDELSYMAMKVRDDVLRDTTDLEFFNQTVKMLNEQSYAMHEFLTLYMKRLTSTKKKTERDIIITVFRDASINNPLFNDLDKELVLAYYNNDNYITQFSLDTDWVAAYKEIERIYSAQ